jgi:hypothetical protein
MANYKHPAFLNQMNSDEFDKLHHAGQLAPWSGIYRCQVCGHECVSTQGHHLPPQDHHTHAQGQPIQWRLVVASAHV